jgi:chemotaxis signal transduction protein
MRSAAGSQRDRKRWRLTREKENMQTFVLFQIGERQFGMDMPLVESIHRARSLFGEQSGETLNNTMELNGEKIVLCDLPTLLGQEESPRDLAKKKVMLVKSGDHSMALIVDRVDGVISVETAQLAPLPGVFEGPALACFPRALARDDDLVLLLEPEGMRGVIGEEVAKT